MKQIYLIFILFFTLHLSAQEEGVIINGIITSDSHALENIHIINLNSKKGTISNTEGKFQITVKLNDYISFSSVQFFDKELQITRKHIENKTISLNLIPKNNELDEVVLQNMAKSLGLPNADVIPLNKLDRTLEMHSKKSVPIAILQTLLFKPGGIDDLYYIFSGNRKSDRKLKELLDNEKQLEIDLENIELIRNHFKDDFFINTLKIPKEDIDYLLKYCLPKRIVFLFERKRYLEIMDILIQNKDNYLQT